MAGNTVNIKMVLTADGVAAQQKAAKDIADNYERANRALSAQLGKRSTAAPMSAAERSTPHTTSTVTEREYGKVRGAVGTGAAGRDFAKQAQGLGGLVALYATFAANIFAVGAAFEALNKAAATERLAKATEMMSVSTGIHLKSVSKNLVEASGYALSFSEAMQFTNIGTSAGLASAQIQSLTKIAKGAANALGRDVGDSVRRIIQGTAKQEQEILDELGIFVKASQAYEKFAAVNKIKVADLTGAQRTQAYANEVERLGAKWNEFAEIPDPFSKFAATGKDALNELLMGVNKLATPFLNFLSESKEGIQALIVLITVSLAKRAIPELGGLFNSLFNYDKDKASASNALMLREVEGTISKVKAAVLKGQQELKALGALTPINADSTKAAFSSLAAVKGGAAGISTASLSTKMSKLTDGYTDLSKLKSAADIEHQITQSLKTQYGYKKDSAGYIQKLVDSNVLVNGSTKENLILSKQAKDIASAHFIEMQKRVNAQGTINTLQKENAANTAILDKSLAEADRLKNSSNKSRAIIEAPTMSTIGDSRTISEAEATKVLATAKEKAAIAQISMRKAIAAGLPVQTEDITSIHAQVLATNQLAAAKAKATVAEIALVGATNKGNLNGLMTDSLKGIEASFNQGGWTGFKNGILDTGKAMGTMLTATQAAGKEIPTFTNSAGMGAKAMSLWTSTTTAASGATKILGIALKGVLGVLSAALGPLMIAWTVWELFGDTIKKWIGIDTEAAARLEAAKKAHAEYAETVGLAALSLKAVNEARVAGITSIEEKIRNDTTELNAYKGHVDAYIKMAAEKKAAAEKASLADMHKNDRPGQVFSEQAFSLTQIASTEGADASKVAQLQALAKETQALANARSLILRDGPALVANTKAQAEVEAKVVEIMKAGIVPMQQRSSMDSKLESSAKSFTKALDEQEKVQKKLGDPTLGLNSERAKSAYDSFKNIVESTSPALIRARILQEDLARMVAMGGKFAAIAAPMYDELAIAQASANTRIAHGLLSPKEAEAELAAFIAKLQGKALSIGKLFNDPAKAPKAIVPYDDKTKNLFASLKNDIDETSLKMKKLTGEQNVSQALETRLSAITGIASMESIAATKRNSDDQAALTLQKELTQASLDYLKVSLDKSKVGKEGENARKEALETLKGKSQELYLTKAQADELAEINRVNSLITRATAETNIALTKQAETQSILKGYADMKLAAQDADLAYAIELGYMTSKEITDAQYLLSVEKERLATKNSLAASAGSQTKEEALPRAILLYDTNNQAALQALEEINAKYTIQNQLIKDGATATAAQAAKTQELKSYLAGNNDQMKLMTELTNSLTGAFGELGTNIGLAGQALLKMAQDDATYARDRVVAEKEVAEEKAHGFDTGAQDKLNKLDKKAAKDKLGNIAATVGATKKMFAEHTGAYKVLNALEKASHALQMINTAREMASDFSAFMRSMFFTTTETTAKVTGAATGAAASVTADGIAAGPKATNAILSAFGAPFPVNFIAGAAMIAIVASLLGGSAPSVSIPGGMGAEDMQKSQGTGQSWVDGKLVDNGGGVFGDPTAKSESIQNSLDLLTATSIEGLSFSNKQIELLTKIKDGIKGVAEAAYGIQGIRSGSGFGTVEGGSSNPGFLGLFASSSSSSIVNSGLKLTGTLKSLGLAGDGVINRFETIATTWSDSGFLGIGGGSGTNISNNIANMETDPKATAADKKAARAIRETFTYMGELLVDSGKKLGLTMEETLSRANSLGIDITASLRGLTGKESQEELSAVFSGILDDAYLKVAPQLKKFRQFGEGFAQTVTRVIDGFDKVNLGLTSMGLDIIKFTEVPDTAAQKLARDKQSAAKRKMDAAKAAIPEAEYVTRERTGRNEYGSYQAIANAGEIKTATKLFKESTDAWKAATDEVIEANALMTTQGYDLSEALIKAAGGLDKFLESAQLYADIFLSEAERLDIKKVGASNRLAEIGAAGTKTFTTEAVAKYDTKAPDALNGKTDNALWEAIVASEAAKHKKTYGVDWNTSRTSDSERAGQLSRMQGTYASEAASLNMGKDSSYGSFLGIGGLKGAREATSTTVKTNVLASELFRTLSDGNDSLIDTKKEYKSVVDAALATSKVVVATGDAAGEAVRQEAIDLYAHLTDPQLLQAQQAIWEAEEEAVESYFEAFATASEKLSRKVGNVNAGLDAVKAVGTGVVVAGPTLTPFQKAMENVGLTSLRTAKDYTTLTDSLKNGTGHTKTMYDGLVKLGPAFLEVINAVDDLVKGISNSVKSSIFEMNYGLKDSPGKYAMLDVEADISNSAMLAAGETNDIYKVAEYATKTIELLNKSWGLLSPEQQLAKLPEFTARLQKIDDFVKEEGADPLSLQLEKDKTTADTMAKSVADAIKEAMPLAMAAATEAITAAAASMATSANVPVTAEITVNVTKSAGTEVSIN